MHTSLQQEVMKKKKTSKRFKKTMKNLWLKREVLDLIPFKLYMAQILGLGEGGKK